MEYWLGCVHDFYLKCFKVFIDGYHESLLSENNKKTKMCMKLQLKRVCRCIKNNKESIKIRMPSISSTLVKVRKPTRGEIPPEN